MSERQIATFVMQTHLDGIELSEVRVLFEGGKALTVPELYQRVDYLDIDLEDHPTVLKLFEAIQYMIEPDLLDRPLGNIEFQSKVNLIGNMLEVRIVEYTSVRRTNGKK